MKRFTAASSLLLALSLIFTGLIGIAAPSAQANIQCNDGTGQLSCEKNGGPAPTVPPPVSTQTCWNGAVIPVTSACPAAPAAPATETCWNGAVLPINTCPALPTTTTTTPTAPTAPVGGCGVNAYWTGSACVTNPTTTTPTAPSPPPGGCGPNTAWNGTFCAPTTTTPTFNPSPPPGGCGPTQGWNGFSCETPTTNTSVSTSPCQFAQQVRDATGACNFPPGITASNTTCSTTQVLIGGVCISNNSLPTCTATQSTNCVPDSNSNTQFNCPVNGQVRDASGSCYFPTTTTTTTTGGSCVPSDWVRTASGACIAPIVGTTSGSGTTTTKIQCTDGTSQSSCEKNGGPAPAVRTCSDGLILPVSSACASAPTTTTTTCSTTQVLIGGVCVSNKSLPTCTATQSTNCVPDSNSSTQFNCPVNGQIRDAGGNCSLDPSTNTTSTNKYDCSTAALRNLDVCGGSIKANLPTCSSNQRLEGLNCVSNTSTTGVFAQSANIKCSDGTFRNTAIECEQSVGGKSTVAITCPSNQVVSPSGAYCIYPTTTGTAQGTYRSECAVTPLPASCLVGAPTTFEGATQMAQKATFNQVLTSELKIQGNNAFDAAGVKVGELAKASNGQVFQAAAPPPPPSSTAGGKAAPKKTTKTSTAPVIVMNVLGADNKEILGPDGKPLQTAPIVKQGNFVYTDSNGSPIMATPTLNAAGDAVVHNGKVLMTRLMTIGGNEAMLDSSGKPIMMVPLLGDDGKPLLAPNGEVLYAPPLVNAAGKTMINASTGQAILARPMADSSGNAALGADKKPFMGQPLLTKDNKLLTIGGQEIYTGAVGMPLTNSKKQQVQTANKQDVQFGFGGTLIDEGGNPVLGPDGKAIVMNANATPLMSNGLPLLDKNGKAVRVNANGQITDSSGRVILGVDGKAIAIGKSESADVMKVGAVIKSTVKAPDGSVAVMALNAQLFDKSGNPIVTASGQPIFFDAKSKKLIDPKGNAVKVEAGGKIVGKISSLAFQTVNFAA